MKIRQVNKRLVLNGSRLVEGENHDWYEKDGKTVFEFRLKECDKLVAEYPNFQEEDLDVEKVYCRCTGGACGGTLIKATLSQCKACEIESCKRAIINCQEEMERSLARRMDDYVRERNSRTDYIKDLKCKLEKLEEKDECKPSRSEDVKL